MKWNINTFDFQKSKDDFATLVLYQPKWETSDWMIKDGLYFPNNQDKITSIIQEALNISQNHNASVVILPELSVPEMSIPTIEEWSKSNSTIVIAGSHYFKTQERYINRTAVILDGSTQYSEKLIPSPLEISPISGKSLMRGKKIVVFKNSQIGDFAVLICADYLEDSLTRARNGQGDVLK
jgi:predicted amidohydrolase